ncbi:hypothetical protein [Desulfobotulus sp.]|uniref:hypothetical protein n=1 Tax=Desulfobotulus sp. TaxID=1940337 RepID=UPI002A3647EB|nr:hypothetical protein [Desulfobotulus sp.]MDY0163072.1 hypothetical protein [Desulfobotulus sp.]
MKPLNILCLCLCFFLYACTENATSQKASPPTPEPGSYAAALSMDSRGGVLQVTDPDNPVFRAAVSIPENQLSSPTTIRIRDIAMPAPLPTPLRAAGPAVDFGPDGLLFTPPALLTLPYLSRFANGTLVPDYQVGVRYYDPVARQWTPMPVKKRDRENKTVSFESRHFSVYIAAVEAPGEDPFTYPRELRVGEYFLGTPEFRLENGEYILIEKGRIGRPGIPAANPFHLLAHFHPREGLILGVDQLPSVNETAGYRARFTEDGTGGILDTFTMFEKIRASGDARHWRWEAVFILDYTRLNNYVAVDPQDPHAPAFPEAQRIYAAIEALNAREVLISWGIDLPAEMDRGNLLCIAFEATYLGPPDGELP